MRLGRGSWWPAVAGRFLRWRGWLFAYVLCSGVPSQSSVMNSVSVSLCILLLIHPSTILAHQHRLYKIHIHIFFWDHLPPFTHLSATAIGPYIFSLHSLYSMFFNQQLPCIKHIMICLWVYNPFLIPQFVCMNLDSLLLVRFFSKLHGREPSNLLGFSLFCSPTSYYVILLWWCFLSSSFYLFFQISPGSTTCTYRSGNKNLKHSGLQAQIDARLQTFEPYKVIKKVAC